MTRVTADLYLYKTRQWPEKNISKSIKIPKFQQDKGNPFSINSKEDPHYTSILNFQYDEFPIFFVISCPIKRKLSEEFYFLARV